MEKLIVEENEIIEEDLYQRIKKEMNKKDDFFNLKELKEFTNIYRKSDVILT